MTSGLERWVGHLDFYVHALRRRESALDFAAALEVIAQMGVAGTNKVDTSDARWLLQLASLEIDTKMKCAKLLFLGIDRERAESVYGDVRTLNLRIAKKKPTEGGAVSAHLVVYLEPDPATGRYKAVLEEMEGMSRSRIVPYIRALLTEYVQFTETLPNGETEIVVSNMFAEIIFDKPIGEQLNNVRC